MAQIPGIPHKRGDTLSFAARAKLPAGEWTATSRMRLPDSDVLVADLVVSTLTELSVPDVDGYTHVYTITHPRAGQEMWPIQLVDCDVQYLRTSDDFAKSTPTFKVRIARDQA